MKLIQLQNSLKQNICAHLFEPLNSNQKIILINSATGVKQQLYFNISIYLSELGFTVLTYDYTGIGLSKPKDLKNCKSSMRSWGTEDFKTLTNFIKKNYSTYRKFIIGHSVGALILGMNEDSAQFERFAFISTQKAFAGHLKFKIKVLAYGGFGLLQPLSTKIFGYFAAHRFGLGESLPAAVANDWRTLILNRNSTNALLEKSGFHGAKHLRQEVLVIYADDDEWLTETGVKSLMTETYPNLKPTYTLLNSKDSPNNTIGHINFFRSYNRSLWDIILKEFQR